MSEYRKQSAFMKELMTLCENNPAHSELSSRLASAESGERCLFCACRLVGMVALLALAGVGYSSVLLPEFFDNTTHVVIRFFTALALGSALCFAVFYGLWSRYRHLANRIHAECRRLILSTVMAQQSMASTYGFHPVLFDGNGTKVISISTNALSTDVEPQRFSKAS